MLSELKPVVLCSNSYWDYMYGTVQYCKVCHVPNFLYTVYVDHAIAEEYRGVSFCVDWHCTVKASFFQSPLS